MARPNPAKLCRVELNATDCFQRVAAISTRQLCRVELADMGMQWRCEAARFGTCLGAALPSAFDTSQHELKLARNKHGKSTDEVQIQDSSGTERLGLDLGTAFKMDQTPSGSRN